LVVVGVLWVVVGVFLCDVRYDTEPLFNVVYLVL